MATRVTFHRPMQRDPVPNRWESSNSAIYSNHFKNNKLPPEPKAAGRNYHTVVRPQGAPKGLNVDTSQQQQQRFPPIATPSPSRVINLDKEAYRESPANVRNYFTQNGKVPPKQYDNPMRGSSIQKGPYGMMPNADRDMSLLQKNRYPPANPYQSGFEPGSYVPSQAASRRDAYHGAYGTEHEGRDVASGIGAGLMPLQAASQRDAYADVYGDAYEGRDTAGGLGVGMVPTQAASRREEFASAYGSEYEGRDSASGLGQGMLPTQAASAREEFAGAYGSEFEGRDNLSGLGMGMVPNIKASREEFASAYGDTYAGRDTKASVPLGQSTAMGYKKDPSKMRAAGAPLAKVMPRRERINSKEPPPHNEVFKPISRDIGNFKSKTGKIDPAFTRTAGKPLGITRVPPPKPATLPPRGNKKAARRPPPQLVPLRVQAQAPVAEEWAQQQSQLQEQYNAKQEARYPLQYTPHSYSQFVPMTSSNSPNQFYAQLYRNQGYSPMEDFASAYGNEYEGRDAASNIGPGMMPALNASRREEYARVYGTGYEDRDTAGGLGAGMVPTQAASQREGFAAAYGEAHEGMDSMSGLGRGMVARREMAQREGFAAAYGIEHEGRASLEHMNGPGLVPDEGASIQQRGLRMDRGPVDHLRENMLPRTGSQIKNGSRSHGGDNNSDHFENGLMPSAHASNLSDAQRNVMYGKGMKPEPETNRMVRGMGYRR